MSVAVAIRDGRPEDAEAVAAIAVAAWQPIYAHARDVLGADLFGHLHPDWEAEKARQVRGACAPDAREDVLVATADGSAVGFVTFRTAATAVGEIGNNAVRPEYQSLGIGGRLYEAALRRLRAAGMRHARVTTGSDPAHAAARRAYEKVGFAAGPGSVTYYRAL